MKNKLKVQSCENLDNVQVITFIPLNAGESYNGIRVADKVIAFLPSDIYNFSNKVGKVIDKEEFEDGKEIPLFYQSHDSMFGSSCETTHHFFGKKGSLDKCLDYIASSLKANPDNIIGQFEDNFANITLFYYDLGETALLIHSGENGYIERNRFFEESNEDKPKSFEDYDINKISSEIDIAFAGAQYDDTSLFELIDIYALLELNADPKYFKLNTTKEDLKKDFEYKEFLRSRQDLKNSGDILKCIVHNLINYKKNLDFNNTINISESDKEYFAYLAKIYK